MDIEQADKMTLQEAVDYAVQKIVEQGGQCLDEVGDCAYGSNCGTEHCAVGWLLDSTSQQLMHHCGNVNGLIEDLYDYLPSVIVNNGRVFWQLQHMHDHKYQIERTSYRTKLDELGIDTSGVWFDQWVEMGKGEDEE